MQESIFFIYYFLFLFLFFCIKTGEDSGSEFSGATLFADLFTSFTHLYQPTPTVAVAESVFFVTIFFSFQPCNMSTMPHSALKAVLVFVESATRLVVIVLKLCQLVILNMSPAILNMRSTCSPVSEAEHAAIQSEQAAILNLSQRAVLNMSRSTKYESTCSPMREAEHAAEESEKNAISAAAAAQ